MDRATYLREVVAAYQGEVRGEATFATLAHLATDAGEIEIWRTWRGSRQRPADACCR